MTNKVSNMEMVDKVSDIIQKSILMQNTFIRSALYELFMQYVITDKHKLEKKPIEIDDYITKKLDDIYNEGLL
jgi:hypothetical protein